MFSLVSGLLIFLFFHGGFLRNYGGDIVAITFLYSLAVLILRPKPVLTAVGVFTLALSIEFLQAFLSLPHSTFSTLVLGGTFDPLDILVYLGSTSVMGVFNLLFSKHSASYDK